MKLTLFIPIFAAALTLASPIDLSPESDVATQVEERELESEYGITTKPLLESRVSKNCYAAKYGPPPTNKIASRDSPSCGMTGTIKTAVPIAAYKDVSSQTCANVCVCPADSSLPDCHAFGFKPSASDPSVGICKLYHKHLVTLDYTTGPGTGTQLSDRTCYYRGNINNLPSGVQSQAVARATFVAKRDPVSDYLAQAMVGV